MTQMIKEAIYEKKYIIETKDPYILALKIIDIATKHGKIIEKENVYETDGPVKEAKIKFDLIIKLSSYSRAKFKFNILGRTNEISFISISINGESQVRIPKSQGLVSEAYYNFFKKHTFIYPIAPPTKRITPYAEVRKATKDIDPSSISPAMKIF